MQNGSVKPTLLCPSTRSDAEYMTQNILKCAPEFISYVSGGDKNV